MPPPGGSLQRSPSSGSKQVSRTTSERASPKAGEGHQQPTAALRSGSSRRGAMTAMPPVIEPAEPDVPPNVRLLAGAERNDKKIARGGGARSGKDAEWKRGIVEQVFQSCSAIANLNCNLDQPTPLSNDGAAMVRKQLELGCTWVNTLWLEKNEIGPAGAEELAQGLRVHKHITDLSLADNPMRTAGFDHICNALALGKCPIFTLNIRNTGVIRIPGTLQDATYLKEIVSEDNPILFPPREVMHRGCARIIEYLKDHRTVESVRKAEMALEEERKLQEKQESFKRGGGTGVRSMLKTPLTERELRIQKQEEKLRDMQERLEFKESSLESLRSHMDARHKDIRETLLYGTWWHSTIPSLDPVGLQWQKPSAAEIDEEKEEELKHLRYTDQEPLDIKVRSPPRSSPLAGRSPRARSPFKSSPAASPGAGKGSQRTSRFGVPSTTDQIAGSQATSPLYDGQKI